MKVKAHYDTHLGKFYSWMVGDFDIKQKEQQDYFISQNVTVSDSGIALDLGAGHGLQSVSLAKIGFKVIAIDFNEQLLSELEANKSDLTIEVVSDDIRFVRNYATTNPELIVCAGDTITHLGDNFEIEQFIRDCAGILNKNGKIFLSFRDYSHPLRGDNRFIPVKSDENKILTCCLDYFDDRILVTDLLHAKTDAGWQQMVSSYYKIRINESWLIKLLKNIGFDILVHETVNRMIIIIAQKTF
ncbi:class I SAM-dependent methyltransferase [Arachidicoccus soli]|uniref:Methyltransferase domain-containing protein n=1 Tax=Arachidicoccus soli TaxID=2341117 RepID=A0A386HRQ9_9BACT|nr:methyltransferase domain-containing protein [Arachidicoccus soli]AYD48339.1 methyltransferase domain-containing protein [Arachidicoccus soli]